MNSGGFITGFCDDTDSVTCRSDSNFSSESNLFQVGASILHKPSGFGIYGL